MIDYSTSFNCINCRNTVFVGEQKCPHCGLDYTNDKVIHKTIKWQKIRKWGNIVITAFFCFLFLLCGSMDEEGNTIGVILVAIPSIIGFPTSLWFWNKRMDEIKPE